MQKVRILSKRSSYRAYRVYYVELSQARVVGWRNDMLGPGKKRWLTPAMTKIVHSSVT